jgi:predicted PurR-regulated permease PerM
MTGGGDGRSLPRVPAGVVLAVLGSVAALWFLRGALAPFFLAMVMAYVLEPLVARLSRRIGREWASVVVIAGAVVLGALLVWAVVPVLWSQGERLVSSLPQFRARTEARLMPWFQAHPGIQAKLKQGMDGLDPMAILKEAGSAGAGILGGLLELITLILVPLILYYLLVEGPRLQRALDGLVPTRHLERIRAVVGDINARLGGYIRGQLAVSVVMSFLQAMGLLAMGVPYAGLLGIVAGFSNVVPYSPYVTALPPALIFAAADGAGASRLLGVALVFTAVQKAETLYFTPVWVGRASRLHPLEVLLAILCFGYAFGFVGLVFAVPLMIVLKVVGREAVRAYRSHPWYRGEA